MNTKKLISFAAALVLVSSMCACSKEPQEEVVVETTQMVAEEWVVSTTTATEKVTEKETEAPSEKLFAEHTEEYKHVKALKSNLDDEVSLNQVQFLEGSFDLAEKSLKENIKELVLDKNGSETISVESLAFTSELTKYQKGEPEPETVEGETAEETKADAPKKEAKKDSDDSKKAEESEETEEEETTEPPKPDEYICLGKDEDKNINIVYAHDQDDVESTVVFSGGIKLGMTKAEVQATSLGEGSELEFRDNVLFYKNKTGFLYIEFNFVTGKACKILLMLPSSLEYEPVPVTWQEQDIAYTDFDSYTKNIKSGVSLNDFTVGSGEDAKTFDITNVYAEELMEMVGMELESEDEEDLEQASLMGFAYPQYIMEKNASGAEQPKEDAKETKKDTAEDAAEAPTEAEKPKIKIFAGQDDEGKLTLFGLTTDNLCGQLPITFVDGIGIGTSKSKVESILGDGTDAEGTARPGTVMYYKSDDAALYIVYREELVKDIWIVKNEAVSLYGESVEETTDPEENETAEEIPDETDIEDVEEDNEISEDTEE